MDRVAVVADIHGNLPALRAVAADIERRSVVGVINLGDHASGPLWPRKTVIFLMAQPWHHIAGDHERMLVRADPQHHGPSDRFAFARLAAPERRWLASLPKTMFVFDEILACHGTPSDDSSYLLEVVERGRARLARPSELRARLRGTLPRVVLCGHSHTPRVVRIDDTLIVNPGSVGLPAFAHDLPELHVIEAGAPDARYALLEQTRRGWRAQLVAVPYDHGAAATQAMRNGRPDWAQGLRTGFMAGGIRGAQASRSQARTD